MKRLAAILLGVASLLLPVAARGGEARRFRLPAAGGEATVLVPEIFEPLLPGSIYPDRRRPAPALSRPAALLLDGAGEKLRRLLLDRGAVVVELRSDGGAVSAKLVDALVSLPEIDPRRLVLVFSGRGGAIDPRFAAAAILSPDPSWPGPAPFPGKIGLFVPLPEGEPPTKKWGSLISAAGDGAFLRWYGASGPLPPEALRDVAELVAGVGAAPPSPVAGGTAVAPDFPRISGP